MRALLLLVLGFLAVRRLLTAVIPTVPEPVVGSKPKSMVHDPVCKVYLAKADAMSSTVDGRLVYFCSESCCEQFLQARAS